MIDAVRTQTTMRAHLLIAILVLLAATVLGVSRVELGIVVLTIALVMVAEMVNTALEAVVDLITEEYRPLARTAKHVAAGAVLLAAAASVVVGYLVFFYRVAAVVHGSLGRAVAAPPMVTLAALVAVTVLVVLIKAGVTPFRIQGGFPSFHAAVAFALATAIYLMGGSPAVTLLALGLAVLVGQARVEGGIHSWYEVMAGAALGTLVTVAVFQALAS
ncbi:MAG: diacylglycerol kinase [Limnochordia bacterium]